MQPKQCVYGLDSVVIYTMTFRDYSKTMAFDFTGTQIPLLVPQRCPFGTMIAPSYSLDHAARVQNAITGLLPMNLDIWSCTRTTGSTIVRSI